MLKGNKNYLIIRVGFQIKASSLASTQFHVKKWIINLGFGQVDLFVILIFRTASWLVFSVKVNFYQTMFFLSGGILNPIMTL
jgi:hypothetical protein